MGGLLGNPLASIGINVGKFMNVRLEACLGQISITINPGAVEPLPIQYNVGIIPMIGVISLLELSVTDVETT